MEREEAGFPIFSVERNRQNPYFRIGSDFILN